MAARAGSHTWTGPGLWEAITTGFLGERTFVYSAFESLYIVSGVNREGKSRLYLR